MADPPPFMVQVDQDSGKIDVAQTVRLAAAPWPDRWLLLIPSAAATLLLRWSGFAFLVVGLFHATNTILWRWRTGLVAMVWATLIVAVAVLMNVLIAHLRDGVRRMELEGEQHRLMMATNTMAAIAEAVRAGIEGREPRPLEPTKH